MMKTYYLLVLSLLAPTLSNADPLSGLISVGSLELKDAGVSLSLDSERISLNGTLPKVCSDRLSISNVQRFDSSRPEDEISGDSIQKADDLKEFSKTIQVQIAFETSTEEPTLKECVLKHHDENPILLSTDPHFARVVSLKPEIAIAGIVGEPMDLKSPEYLKLESQFKKFDCKDCNSSWKSVQAHLSEAQGTDSPFLSAMMSKLMESTLSETDKRIDEAKSTSELIRIRNDLTEMEEFLNSDELKGLHLGLFEKLISKNDQLAQSGFKTASMASAHVDFNKDTYQLLSKLKTILPEQREEYRSKSASLGKGSDERVSYLSMIDPDHPEVKTYLEGAQTALQSLQMKMHQTCMGPLNQRNFTQCGELQNEYFSSQRRYSELNQRYVNGYNQNWTGIFSYWDKWKVNYNLNWKNTFPIPSQGNPQTMQPNQGSYFYDPQRPDQKSTSLEGMNFNPQGQLPVNPLFTNS